MPLSIADHGPTARHPAHCSVLQLQLQLPAMHGQHDPRAVLVAPRKENHPLRIIGLEVELGAEAATREAPGVRNGKRAGAAPHL